VIDGGRRPGRPIVLYVDQGFDHSPIAGALEDELDARLGAAAKPTDAHEVVAIVTGVVPVGIEDAERHPALRSVVTCSIGTDHIDVDGLAARGIAVRNTPTYCTDEVADHALACVLAGLRGLVRLDAAVRAGRWDYAAAGLLRRVDSACLGIVGHGRIGRSLAAKASALGMTVLAYDPYVEEAPHAELVGLDELLGRADAVSLHMPGNAGMAPVLGAPELDRLRPHAILVNLSRPALVDLDAMLARLADGRLAGAFWDVWPEEPADPADPRLSTPGLIVSPHAAWYSAEAETANYAEAIEALRDTVLS
jgi:D-3-phosphoglycerate dehydrogenase / 2-oxoglutarate reductase